MLGEEGIFQKWWSSEYLNAQYPLPISIVISDGVADVSHICVISTIDGSCENLSLRSAASCASLGSLKKVKMSFFLLCTIRLLLK